MPALTLAALAAVESRNDPVLIATPADHNIANELAFQQAMHEAIAAAATGDVILLGIIPDKPETCYGYIKMAFEGEVTGLAYGHCVE